MPELQQKQEQVWEQELGQDLRHENNVLISLGPETFVTMGFTTPMEENTINHLFTRISFAGQDMTPILLSFLRTITDEMVISTTIKTTTFGRRTTMGTSSGSTMNLFEGLCHKSLNRIVTIAFTTESRRIIITLNQITIETVVFSAETIPGTNNL